MTEEVVGGHEREHLAEGSGQEQLESHNYTPYQTMSFKGAYKHSDPEW